MKKETNLIRKIYRNETIKKIERKIAYLGVYYNYSAIKLLNLRFITSIALFFAILLLAPGAFVLAPVVFVIYYYGVEYLFLDYRIKKRVKKLDMEALYFFEILALSLESGRNLKNALDMSVANINSEISREFKKTLNEVNLGKTLNEALNDMKKRIPSDAINNVILNITQANTMGTALVDFLYTQADYLRDNRLLEIKGDISKIPIKISIVSVIFFIPIMLLIVLSPVIINLMIG